MNKREKTKIIKQLESLTDKEIEQEYYDSVFNCLGSACEDMYEMGYDISDIIAQEKHEKWRCQYSDIVEECCIKRGIKLWENRNNEWNNLRC